MVSPLASLESLNDERAAVPPSPQILSLLSVRRPSLAGPSDPLASFHIPEPAAVVTDGDFFRSPVPEGVDESPVSKPDFSQRLQIKMQGWVGDGVGKMSISPSGRDVVLAARSGLYVIDLETPLEVPRFLPQGGTWDVADVQWNPHPSRANCVVSTSSDKLLIWNLDRPDRSAIQFILSRHYRSITDLNWHNHHPDIVASTGIDSWIWMWDLRTSVRPVTGLCAFNPPATQVKWNRHDENILASSHGSLLLIWDQRKGAVPLTTIKAHTARVHGMDWSRRDKDEIVSCSLDQSIKFWNTSTSDAGTGDAIPRPLTDAPTHIPRKRIDTVYPIWRARHVPFGNGVLSLPQRGIQRPELFYGEGQRPIRIIPESGGGEGQADIVKEYVWRTKGGADMGFDDREFQLVTWSEDKTLRAWPIDTSILEEAGFVRGAQIEDRSHRIALKYESYRTPNARAGEHMVPAHTGDYGILSGIRAGPIGAPKQHGVLNIAPSSKATGAGTGTFRRGGTMTKGTGKSKRSALHALAWMPSVTVGEKKDGSGPDSLASSRISLDPSSRLGTGGRGSESPQTHPSHNSEFYDSEAPPSWAEELTSVVNGLSSSKTTKVSLEKMDLKKRMCTLGLQGPWGESSSVFIRVTFIFPREYPRFVRPQSLPHIDLERNHLIPIKNRAFLLRELRILREKPPCLEACLRFLLGLPNKRGIAGRSVDTDSGSSSDEEKAGATRSGRDPSVSMRGQAGLAEPRTSQGVFGLNGELVCFSHIPLRMVRTMGRSISLSPSTSSRVPRNSMTGLNQSSGVLSDALRRLTAVAHDRQSAPPTATGADENLLRTLESLAQPKIHHVPDTPQSSDVLDAAFLVRPVRKSTVSIRDMSEVTGLDTTVAREYAVSAADAGSFCQHNARVARTFGRTDHERLFKTLCALLSNLAQSDQKARKALPWHQHHLARSIILSFYDDIAKKKDVIMLAMISVALLISEKRCKSMRKHNAPHSTTNGEPPPDDYFSLRHRPTGTRVRGLSDASFSTQSSIRSPTTPGPAASLSSSASSRGSWSSILNASASGVRFFMTGQEGLSTPKPPSSPVERSRSLAITADAQPRAEGSSLGSRTLDNTEKVNSPPSNGNQKYQGTLKSWSEPVAPASHTPSRITISFASAGHQDPNEVVGLGFRPPRKRLVLDIRTNSSEDEWDHEGGPENVQNMSLQLAEHVVVYGEFLFRLGLLHKRLELLKCLPKDSPSIVKRHETNTEELVTIPVCHLCGAELGSESSCVGCGPGLQKPSCSVCRLPATGLAHVCLVCCHTTHLQCWQSQKLRSCPTGCGCDCLARGDFDIKPQTLHSPLAPLHVTSPSVVK